MKDQKTLESELKKAEIIEKVFIDIYDLKANDLNVIIYGFEKDIIEGLAESIKVNGLIKAIVINENKKIISGHLRWAAFKLLDEADKNEENPTGKYKTIPAEVKKFDDSVISEEEYFFISNEGRSRNTYQQLHEMERWSKILQKSKYDHLSLGGKREIIVKRVGLGSDKTYYRAKKALDYIEQLRKEKGSEQKIAKLMKRFEDKSWDKIEKIVKQEKNKPTPEALAGAELPELEEFIEDFELDIDLEDYDEDNNPVQGIRKAIGEMLDIDLDKKKYKKDRGEAVYTYRELLMMSKYELYDLVERYSLDIELNKYKKYQNPIFLCRTIARCLGIKVPEMTAQELVSLNLDDLSSYSKQNELGLKLKDYKDPYLIYLHKVGNHLKIDSTLIDQELERPFIKKSYQRNFRSIKLGWMKMAIRESRKSKLQKIEIMTEKADSNTKKLAELISKIDSKNLDELLDHIKSKSNSTSES